MGLILQFGCALFCLDQDSELSGNPLPIPVNLYTNRITATEATVGWELQRENSNDRTRLRERIRGFQVRYHEAVANNSPSYKLKTATRSVAYVNVTEPDAITAVLRNLQPETAYEFAVRSLPLYESVQPHDNTWSMVNGFETSGQRKSHVNPTQKTIQPTFIARLLPHDDFV